MKKIIIVLTILFFIFGMVSTAMATTFYLDYELGNDANDGSDWVNAWKTFALGATEARIAPGDIIRIAKSPAPSSIGNGTWTNLSKTVTLATAQTLNIDMCETAWTGAGDTTVERTAVATDGKEGSYCMKLTVDASPQASILQAFFATGELDLSAYQKISFWIKNNGIISEDDWIVNLCSDVAGVTVVDSFLIPAIPSINRWLPLTLTKDGGGNLGASIKSIAIYSGSGIPLASKYIYVDDFIACTTDGLNLQSLISKDSAEQGGTEGWFGIQSINGTTVMLDNAPNTKAEEGRGYSGATETVATYKRETIKTDLATGTSTKVHEVMDSGTSENNIEFQGGYNTTTNEQTGETFFDGLNGFGYGIYLNAKNYITLNYLNVCRYNSGIMFYDSNSNTITTVSANNNNSFSIYFYFANNNTITTITSVNNNSSDGIRLYDSNNNTINTITNVNNNGGSGGIYFNDSNNNTIATVTNANNNNYGIYFFYSDNNAIKLLSTTGNATAGIFNDTGTNYLHNALIAEATEVDGFISFANPRIFSHKHDQTAYHRILTDGGQIDSVATDRVGGTGIMWKLAVTSVNRASTYPLNLKIAKIACVADKLVTVKAYMKITSTTDILGALVCRGGQLTGVANDVKTNASTADTDWHEITITFPPTEAGVIEIEAWAWWVANLADESVYIEDMTISQEN